MNNFQTANIRRQIIRALRIAGAVDCEVTRAGRDANGMPTGEKLAVCTLYGLKYRRTSQLSGLLQIAMPGIVMQGGQNESWCGIIRHGDTPQAGDTLHIGEEAIQIVYAQEDMGVIAMVLGGSIT